MRARSAVIIGAGAGGLGLACILAKAGYKVTVVEKNKQVGGRAGQFKVSLKGHKVARLDAALGAGEARTEPYTEYGEGVLEPATTRSAKSSGRVAGSARKQAGAPREFVFDTGPSWFLMPDVFEHFFDLIGEDLHKHLKLTRLAPSYRVFYKDNGVKTDIYSQASKDTKTFEDLEEGAGKRLKDYLKLAATQYSVAKKGFLYKNYDSINDFFNREMLSRGHKLGVWRSLRRHVGKYFKSDYLQKILLYPMMFLGSDPYSAPAIYGLLNHVDLKMGVLYPKGGMYKLVEALERIAVKNGVKIRLGTAVEEIIVEGNDATGVRLSNDQVIWADTVISNADIHHTEQTLLEPEYRSYSERYWQKRALAPSALLIYLGVRGSLPNLSHHNLFFSKNWRKNFDQIFYNPDWPDDPSFYVSVPSKTDKTVAPAGHQNMFVMVPVAPDLDYTDKILDNFASSILKTIEDEAHIKDLTKRIVYKKLFSAKDFASVYNSYKGSALGLAHTWDQTAIFRPGNVSKKVNNLYFVGANTNPGIGLPSVLISAELVYKRLIGSTSAKPLKDLKS